MTSTRQLIKRLGSYRGSIARRGLVAAALLVIGPAISILLLWLVKGLVDDVFVGARADRFIPYLSAYAAVVAAKLGLDYLSARLDASITTEISNNLRSDVYRRVISLAPGSLPKHGVGDILTHLSGDVERSEYLVYSGPVALFSNLVSCLFFIGCLLLLSWKLTACAIVVGPLLALVTLRTAPAQRRMSRITRRRNDAWMTLAEERLGSLAIVQAFNAQGREADRFAARCAASRRAELRGVKMQSRVSAIFDIIAGVGGILILGVGASEIQHGGLSVGALIAFIGSVGSLFSPLRGVARAWSQFQRNGAAAQRIVKLLDAESIVAERGDARPLRASHGALEFRDVEFAYPKGPKVLNGISLKIEPGETVAIVGGSGAGKSTLARLAMRLQDPTRGEVLIDGVDLRELTLRSLRETACVVFQEPHILKGSIAETIRYGAPDATPEQIREAARAAHAESFIEAGAGGYGAPVGARGDRLSGGQRQRLALARALINNPPILILDEATAGVDSETEAMIQDAIDRLSGRRTIVVIGHRLSSVQRADRIVVLDQGRIVESGSPALLMNTDSRFRDLFANQIQTLGRAA